MFFFHSFEKTHGNQTFSEKLGSLERLISSFARIAIISICFGEPIFIQLHFYVPFFCKLRKLLFVRMSFDTSICWFEMQF